MKVLSKLIPEVVGEMLVLIVAGKGELLWEAPVVGIRILAPIVAIRLVVLSIKAELIAAIDSASRCACCGTCCRAVLSIVSEGARVCALLGARAVGWMGRCGKKYIIQ